MLEKKERVEEEMAGWCPGKHHLERVRGNREGTLKDRGLGRSKDAKGEENFRATITAREFKLILLLSGS